MNRAANAAPTPQALEAIDDPHTLPELGSAALITIDVQRDVLDGGGFPIAGTSAALPTMRRVVESFRRAHRPIVHIVRIYERDGSNAEPCRRQLLAAGAELLIRDTPGCQIASELLPDPSVKLDGGLLLDGGAQALGEDEVALYKPRWGAFYGTSLQEHLHERAVSTVVFAGCNFPNCPRTSIYEASERDFRVVVIRDAVSGLYERAERELTNIGVHVLDSGAVLGALDRGVIRSSHG
jgi:nicotinamidase-related amidase